MGPGGIGKSRLAIEVARNAGERFDRVTFVSLAQVRDPDEVLGAIARELGVRDTGDAPLSEQLGIARAGRRDLIVLDNFEQIVDAAPDVVSLLTDLPGATFLVTSRVRLRVRGEQVFDVEPLGLPPEPSQASIQAILEAPAVQLFRDRARSADPRFDVTDDNAEDVARICRALEGVPLAIELAAARIRALTPAAMLGRLDRMLPLLVTAARDVPERQRTIQATVEWSIDLLGADARALFERLGVFAGDFSLDAVEAVTAGEPWAADLLGTLLELVDGSLLRQHDEHALPLFSMLVPVREIAAARFELDPDAAAVRRAHAEYYVRLAAETELLLRGATQSAALDRLEAERDDLRAGCRHLIAVGEVDVVADVVWRLFLYWWIRGLLPEVKAWMEVVLESGQQLSTPCQGDRARVLVMGRALAARFGDQHRAHGGGRRALPRGRRRVQRGVGPQPSRRSRTCRPRPPTSTSPRSDSARRSRWTPLDTTRPSTRCSRACSGASCTSVEMPPEPSSATSAHERSPREQATSSLSASRSTRSDGRASRRASRNPSCSPVRWSSRCACAMRMATPTRSKDSPDRPLSSATSSAPASSSVRPKRCARARASTSSART